MLRWCLLSPDSPRVSAEYDGRSAHRSFRLPLGSTSVKRLRRKQQCLPLGHQPRQPSIVTAAYSRSLPSRGLSAALGHQPALNIPQPTPASAPLSDSPRPWRALMECRCRSCAPDVSCTGTILPLSRTTRRIKLFERSFSPASSSLFTYVYRGEMKRRASHAGKRCPSGLGSASRSVYLK